MKYVLLALFIQVGAAYAGLSSNQLFRVQGKKQIVTFKRSHTLGSNDLLYYIPKSVDMSKPTTVVFYLHGGNSNMSQASATGAAQDIFYQRDGLFSKKEGMKNIADQYNFIVVMPTTTQGWNWNAVSYMRDVLRVVRAELNPDPDRLYLAGHSMGAMGICRSVNQLTDEFAMFIPVSGGFQTHLKDFEQVGPFYNTRVWVTTGELDYDYFKKWNDEFKQFLFSENVKKFFHGSQNPDWVYEIHPGTHNPNIPYLSNKFEHFLKTERNLYQKELFGFFTQARASAEFKDPGRTRYFWMEAKEMRELDANENSFSINFRLYSEGNSIHLYLDRPYTLEYDYRPHIKKVRLHLSSRLFDLKAPIEILVHTRQGIWNEQALAFKGHVMANTSAAEAVQKESGDKGFLFQSYVDLELSKN